MVTEIRTVKLTIKKLKEIEPSLAKLLTGDMPIKTAYRMARVAKSVKKELMDLEQFRQERVKLYGMADDKGNIRVPDDKMAEFKEVMDDFMQKECSISFIPATLDELDALRLSAIDISMLEDFINEVPLDLNGIASHPLAARNDR